MGSLIYRVCVASSIDGGETFDQQTEAYPGGGGTLDCRYNVSRIKTNYGQVEGVSVDILTNDAGGSVRFVTMNLSPGPVFPATPRVNKFNRKRTFGNEL